MTDDLVKWLRGWDHCWPSPGLERAVAKAADRIVTLTAERNRLALAICGGEDAPGYANAQTVETLEHVAKQNQQAHGATINSLLAAEAERDEALNQLDSAIHSVEVLEKRTAAVMEDRKFILEERDRTFALMLARAEKAEAERDRLREALEYILAECTLSDNTVPSVGAIKYAARAALKGETP